MKLPNHENKTRVNTEHITMRILQRNYGSLPIKRVRPNMGKMQFGWHQIGPSPTDLSPIAQLLISDVGPLLSLYFGASN